VTPGPVTKGRSELTERSDDTIPIPEVKLVSAKLTPDQLEQAKLCARLAAELALSASVHGHTHALTLKIKRQLDEQFTRLSLMLEETGPRVH
jgi:hypothetical protein